MDKSGSDVCNKDISVKISNDRGKICINVNGSVSASRAVASANENLPGMHYENFVKPGITAVSGGYVMNIIGRKSVKDYLNERSQVMCETIFSVAETVKKIFDTYGEIFFSQILFDYGTVFVKNNSLAELDFVFVPFSNYDEQRAKFSEFLCILFLHMSEYDIESEETVKVLLKSVSKWESDGYKRNGCGEFEKCLAEYKNMTSKNRKKDLFLRGKYNIKGLFEDLHTNSENKRNFRITISSDETKVQYSYVYDSVSKRFFCVRKNGIDSKEYFETIRIGRDKSWAVVHVDDMTVGGRYGEIFFENGKFALKIRKNILPDREVLNEKRISYTLKNGQKIKVGKNTYTVKVHSSTR